MKPVESKWAATWRSLVVLCLFGICGIPMFICWLPSAIIRRVKLIFGWMENIVNRLIVDPFIRIQERCDK